MNITCKREQFTESVQSAGAFSIFYTEASELGLAPGTMPKTVVIQGVGNGQPFILVRRSPEVFEYTQQFGNNVLEIFND